MSLFNPDARLLRVKISSTKKVFTTNQPVKISLEWKKKNCYPMKFILTFNENKCEFGAYCKIRPKPFVSYETIRDDATC